MADHEVERRRLQEFVEQFAAILSSTGLQRMSARVFSYILVDDAETYTAAEIAEGLDISLAAVSGSVRELIAAGLLSKGRRPSTRADVYRLHDDDVWGTIMLDRDHFLDRYQETAVIGIDTLPPGPGRDRLVQTAAFMEFLRAEMAELRLRWRDRREELSAAYEARRRDRGASN